VPGGEGSAGECATGRFTAGTLVYAASLAKQVTAGCAALLARDGALDVDAPLAHFLPELPPWAATVRVRHLIHHTSGLPLGDQSPPAIDRAGPAESSGRAAPGEALPGSDRARLAEPDRTTAGVLAAAGDGPVTPPGTRYAYSNVGYVALGAVVERVAGRSLDDVARARIFEPLGMTAARFWTGPGPAPAGAAPLDPVHPAPLSAGDGGMWSTAADLLRWCAGLDADALGITARVQTPGRLDDDTPLGYAWGMGVRASRGRTVYRHGGSYADVRTMLIRVPEEGFDLVILALADRTERWTALADDLIAQRPG